MNYLGNNVVLCEMMGYSDDGVIIRQAIQMRLVHNSL